MTATFIILGSNFATHVKSHSILSALDSATSWLPFTVLGTVKIVLTALDLELPTKKVTL